MSEAVFIDGLFFKHPHENAPDFIKCDFSVKRDDFIAWLMEQDTNADGYINGQIKESKSGKLYGQLNDFVPKNPTTGPEESDGGSDGNMPF